MAAITPNAKPNVSGRRYLAPWALLPGGWRRDVTITVDEGGTIVAVEADSKIARQPGAPPHILPGPVVPAMSNIHVHSFQRLLAGRTQKKAAAGQDDFWSWRAAMYRLANTLAPDELMAIAVFVYAELLAAGYSLIGEFHYLHRTAENRPSIPGRKMAETFFHAAAQVGVRLTLLPALYQFSGFARRPPAAEQRRFLLTLDEYLELHTVLTDLAKLAGQPLPGVAVHSLRAVDIETAQELRRALRKIPFHLHIAEQPAEVEACVAVYGTTPIRLALERLELDDRCCLVHATHGRQDELAAVAASGAVVGLCPGTEADLGDGFFPLAEFLAAGGRFALGSDSNLTISPFIELQRLEHQARGTALSRNRLAPVGEHSGTWLWQHAAQAGAQALGQACGAIAAGAVADWLVLRPLSVLGEALPVDKWLDAAILSDGLIGVDEVYVAGIRRVAAGRHLEFESCEQPLRAALRRLETRTEK